MGALPKCQQHSKSWTEGRKWYLSGLKEADYLSHHQLPSTMCIIRKMGLGVEPKSEFNASKVSAQLLR